MGNEAPLSLNNKRLGAKSPTAHEAGVALIESEGVEETHEVFVDLDEDLRNEDFTLSLQLDVALDILLLLLRDLDVQ